MGNEASSQPQAPHESGGAGAGGASKATQHHKLRSIQRMDIALRKKLKGGVHYNMKIVLRGERGCGKTCLLHRLQGHPFISEYTPTPEIQTATINWSFKNVEEGVKVEVWDVVDRGIRVRPGERPRIPDSDDSGYAADDNAPAGLRLDIPIPLPGGRPSSSSFGVLDATMVDVYKQCQCAVFLVNPLSAKALEYLAREVPLVPASIPILLLLNFRDKLPVESTPPPVTSATSPTPEGMPVAEADTQPEAVGSPPAAVAADGSAAAAEEGKELEGEGQDGVNTPSVPALAVGDGAVGGNIAAQQQQQESRREGEEGPGPGPGGATTAQGGDAGRVETVAQGAATDEGSTQAPMDHLEPRSVSSTLEGPITKSVLEDYARGPCFKGRMVHVFECSMENCFGLRTLYSYFDVPFLTMKADLLRRQLEQATTDLSAAHGEVKSLIEQDTYGKYSENVRAKRAATTKAAIPPVAGVPPVLATPQGLGEDVMHAQPQEEQLLQQHRQSSQSQQHEGEDEISPAQQPAPVERETSRGRKGHSHNHHHHREHNRHPPSGHDEGKDRRSRRRGNADGLVKEKTGVRIGKDRDEAGLKDVNDFTYRPTTGTSELDDFFAAGSDDEEAEARRQAEYERIASFIKPELRGKASRRNSRASSGGASRDGSMMIDDDEGESGDEPFVYVGLAPVNMAPALQQGSARLSYTDTSQPRAPPSAVRIPSPPPDGSPGRTASTYHATAPAAKTSSSQLHGFAGSGQAESRLTTGQHDSNGRRDDRPGGSNLQQPGSADPGPGTDDEDAEDNGVSSRLPGAGSKIPDDFFASDEDEATGLRAPPPPAPQCGLSSSPPEESLAPRKGSAGQGLEQSSPLAGQRKEVLTEAARAAIAATMQSLGGELEGPVGGGSERQRSRHSSRRHDDEGGKKERKHRKSDKARDGKERRSHKSKGSSSSGALGGSEGPADL